jgi:hypothetical protein
MKTHGIPAALALFWIVAPGPAAGQEAEGLFQGVVALGAAELAGERGGESAGVSNIEMIEMGADVQDNIVVDSVSGNNYVSGDAFNGASGFSTIIQNSGNHVVIQNATIVNLSVGK